MQDVRDGKAKMAEDAVNQYLQYYFMVKRPAENAEASKAWLEKIEKKSGVKKTESGLLYKVTKQGDASMMPKDPRDVVKVHYTGRTREGKVFDTSIFKNRSKEQQEMMRKQSPDKEFIPAPPNDSTCACNECNFMRLNTMEKLYNLSLIHI